MSFQDPNCTIVITNIENREYSFRIKFEAMYCWQLVSMGDLPLPLDEFYSNNEPTTFQPFLANWLKDVSRRYEVCTIYSTEKFIIFSKCFLSTQVIMASASNKKDLPSPSWNEMFHPAHGYKHWIGKFEIKGHDDFYLLVLLKKKKIV